MKAICCTVKSEGGIDLQDIDGIPRSADNGITVVTASTTLIPLLSIRPKTTFNSLPNLGIALPKLVDIQASDAIRLVVIHGGTLTSPTWADVNTSSSMMEVDVAASGITGGNEIFSDYIPAASTGPASGRFTGTSGGLLGKTVLWDRQSTETGILTVAAIRTAAVDADCLVSLQWDEIR